MRGAVVDEHRELAGHDGDQSARELGGTQEEVVGRGGLVNEPVMRGDGGKSARLILLPLPKLWAKKMRLTGTDHQASG